MIGERANFLRVFAIIILFFLIVENISWIKKLLLLSASFIIIIFFVSTNEHLKTRFYEQFIKPAIVEFDAEYLVNNNMYFANYDRAYRIYKKNVIHDFCSNFVFSIQLFFVPIFLIFLISRYSLFPENYGISYVFEFLSNF